MRDIPKTAEGWIHQHKHSHSINVNYPEEEDTIIHSHRHLIGVNRHHIDIEEPIVEFIFDALKERIAKQLTDENAKLLPLEFDMLRLCVHIFQNNEVSIDSVRKDLKEWNNIADLQKKLNLVQSQLHEKLEKLLKEFEEKKLGQMEDKN